MSVDAHVADGPSQVLVLGVGDVAARLNVDVRLGQAEVHHVDHRLVTSATADQAVFRLDVTVDQVD